MPKLKDAEAFALIDVFAKRLLELTGGKPIPRQWERRFKQATKPVPRPCGRQTDIEKRAVIIECLVSEDRPQGVGSLQDTRPMAQKLEYDEISAQDKRDIAKKAGVHPKTIERMIPELQGEATMQWWREHRDSIAKAIHNRLVKTWRKEKEEHKRTDEKAIAEIQKAATKKRQKPKT